MHIKNEEKTEYGVHWKITFDNGMITIIAKNLTTGRRKVCEYECPYNFRNGYNDQDIIEIYRLVEEFVEGLRDEP